ncbi:MAG: carboxypeptidase-like regulatory domain-containing protein [Bacteroidales bacterium]|nr:MAG: carboxypeptidase-like regulatory domain-containing protein [Bacteroidales bacterium]
MRFIGVLATILFVAPYLALTQGITVKGEVMDNKTGEPLAGVNIYLQNKTVGTITNSEGEFEINVNSDPPFILVFSIIGYLQRDITVSRNEVELSVEMNEEIILGQEIVISASRVRESLLRSPVSIEKLDMLELNNTSSANFYDGLHTINNVDMIVHSLTFRTLNTRGFNGDANYRLNQLIDGVDNTAPGMSFAAGNIFGVSPLDIQSVELLIGASSALYGPGGMNGTLLMSTKNPFDFQGLSFSTQTGVMNIGSDLRSSPSLVEDINLRFAKSFSDKFAFKITASYLRAKDWYAGDYRDRTNLDDRNLTRESNPGYDGVNVYGDDIIVPVNLKNIAPTVAEGMAERQGILPGTPEYNELYNLVISLFPDQVITRTGYEEKNFVDYNTENIRLKTALHYRINDRIEAMVHGAYGKGTSVYTAINRFSLRDFSIFSGKIELQGPNFYIRTYGIAESSGNTFDAGTAGLQLNEAWKPSAVWYEDYIGGFAQQIMLGSSEESAHKFARLLADNRDEYGNIFTEDEPARPLPGTEEFDEIFNRIISIPANDGGALVVDNSKVWHAEGLYDLRESIELVEIILGVSHRIYSINSEGTIFIDEPGEPIIINQFGAFTQVIRKLMNDKLKLTGSARYDKNEYFKGRFTPRFSCLFSVGPENLHNFRGSYQTAFRFPSIADQWVDLNTGMFTVLGGLPDVQNRYGFSDNPVYPLSGTNPITDYPVTEYGPFNIPEFGPEKVNAIEIGYKGLLMKKMLLVDASVYQNIYNGFQATQVLVQNPDTPDEQRFKTVVSTDDPVTAYGWAVSADLRLMNGYMIKANISNNQLEPSRERPPGFQSRFNTPAYRTNLSLGHRKITRLFGFQVNWHWQNSFLWESDFGVSQIPAFSTLDAQISITLKKLKSMIKIGGSNLLNNYYTTSFGSAQIGGLYYITWLIDEFLN